MDAISFREAKPADAPAIGRLHVAAWRESYADLLPPQMLEAVSPEGRAAMWSAALNDPAAYGGTAVFVAESMGRIVGFAACSGQRDDTLKSLGYDGEIAALYVLKDHQGAGAGRGLMRLMARRLLEQRRTAAALWVLAENLPARGFYERLGGALAGEKVEGPPGAVLKEIAYGWTDLARLAG